MADMPRTADDAGGKSVAVFFLLVFALSVPLWLLGAATGATLFSGLPVGALMAFCPAAAASILIYRRGGRAGLVAFLKRAGDWRRIEAKLWLAPALLLMPAVMAFCYLARQAAGAALPPAHVVWFVPLLMFVAFFAAALGEELGWSGYAIEPMQRRFGALAASLLLGLVWSVWHYVPLLQVHRPADWIAWWTLSTLSLRVLTVWIYNNSGRSVFAAALFHAMSNVSTLLVPAWYDPRTESLLLAATAAAVTAIWSPRTLAGGERA